MFPRYGRKNKKYRVKLGTDKISFEQKIKVQIIISTILLGLSIAMSCFNFIPKKRINTYLYHTYSFGEWRQTLYPAAKTVHWYSKKAVSLYLGLFTNDGKKESKVVSQIPEVKAENVKKEKNIAAKNLLQKKEEKSEPIYEEWIWPHSGSITSPFGDRTHPITGQNSFHGGIDIAASYGEDVMAVHSGKVENIGYDDANGNYVILSHGNEITSIYIHLSEITVNKGDQIPARGIVGKVGATGLATGPHIHFEIKENGKSVNPQKYIPSR